jgi:nitrite reductase (NADH) large subunit
MTKKKKHVVVIGNGMTSLRFCEKLLEYDAHHEFRVTILGEESLPAYDRIALSSIFTGNSDADLVFSEVRWYAYHKMDLHLGTRVVSIDRDEKKVTTSDGKTIEYDHLVIATGARAHVPAIAGTNLSGVHVYRTTDDINAIRLAGETATHAVVIGGGLLGLEAAEACREMGLATTIVERESWLMACQLDAAGGELLRGKVEALDMNVRTGEHVIGLEGDASVRAVRLENAEYLPANLVILATGIQPNDELGREAGLDVGVKGGIVIDKTVRTSDPGIYAIGECASFNETTFGLVAPCYAMAEAAAANLGGINKTFDAEAPASQLKLLDLQVASMGETHLSDAMFVIDQDLDIGVYKKLILSPDGKQLLGAILMGETSEFERLRKRIEEKSGLPENPRELLAPIGSPFEPELDLEDDDVVCFCNYVTKGDICKAIDRDHLKTTSDVMGSTYAASLCGSCLDTVDLVTKHHVALRDG